MSDPVARALLVAARAHIVSLWSNPSGDRLRESRAIVARIDAFIAEAGVQVASASLVEEVRAKWHAVDAVRLEDKAVVRADARGLWISAWLLTHQKRRLTQDSFDAALAALTLMAREVYLLHRMEGLSFKEIGDRLGLEAPTIESLFYEAMRGLHQTIYTRR